MKDWALARAGCPGEENTMLRSQCHVEMGKHTFSKNDF